MRFDRAANTRRAEGCYVLLRGAMSSCAWTGRPRKWLQLLAAHASRSPARASSTLYLLSKPEPHLLVPRSIASPDGRPIRAICILCIAGTVQRASAFHLILCPGFVLPCCGHDACARQCARCLAFRHPGPRAPAVLMRRGLLRLIPPRASPTTTRPANHLAASLCN